MRKIAIEIDIHTKGVSAAVTAVIAKGRLDGSTPTARLTTYLAHSEETNAAKATVRAVNIHFPIGFFDEIKKNFASYVKPAVHTKQEITEINENRYRKNHVVY